MDASKIRGHLLSARKVVAVAIWKAEYRRATGRERNLGWDEAVSDDDKERYLFVADAVLEAFAANFGE